MARINRTIELVEKNRDLCYLPELLRVKARLLLSTHSSDKDVEAWLTLAINKSADMGARAWELRAATDLAALWIGDRRLREARTLLMPIFERFDEGRDTTNVKAAKTLLEGAVTTSH